MKKFVGLVNGKSFDNEKDFNEAANMAIKSNDGNLAISSYYSYTNDDDNQALNPASEDKDDDKYVSTYEYFLGESEPDVIDANTLEYKVSDELKNRLKEASNKDCIKRSLDFHISKLEDSIKLNKTESENLQEEIEKLQNKLYKEEDTIKDLMARKKYYDTIFDIVKSSEKDDEVKKVEEKKQEEKQVTKEEIKRIAGIDSDMSFYLFLKKLGFLK